MRCGTRRLKKRRKFEMEIIQKFKSSQGGKRYVSMSKRAAALRGEQEIKFYLPMKILKIQINANSMYSRA